MLRNLIQSFVEILDDYASPLSYQVCLTPDILKFKPYGKGEVNPK